MGWTAGADVSTGDLISASDWNNYLGATGSLEYLYDTLIPKELWVPVTGFWDTSVGNFVALDGSDGDYICARLRDADDAGFMTFRCPENFSAITTAAIVVIPKATQAAADWDIHSDYGAEGEDPQTHNESDTTSTYNVTLDVIFHVDVSSILSSLVAGDYVGLAIYNKNAAHDVYVLGFYMKFT